ncbi:hypothetical protein OCU04_002252 [Sclerotinia nivalis]|uniref:Uncharacterized protein n=1 Tax=Sclerotinia nivalis TaxID=352851 RepID=A0A9X0B091_9HELO|nr:hypothetical protein OCU04_002252 [Sclerotinia nivalis]
MDDLLLDVRFEASGPRHASSEYVDEEQCACSAKANIKCSAKANIKCSAKAIIKCSAKGVLIHCNRVSLRSIIQDAKSSQNMLAKCKCIASIGKADSQDTRGNLINVAQPIIATFSSIFCQQLSRKRANKWSGKGPRRRAMVKRM